MLLHVLLLQLLLLMLKTMLRSFACSCQSKQVECFIVRVQAMDCDHQDALPAAKRQRAEASRMCKWCKDKVRTVATAAAVAGAAAAIAAAAAAAAAAPAATGCCC